MTCTNGLVAEMPAARDALTVKTRRSLPSPPAPLPTGEGCRQSTQLVESRGRRVLHVASASSCDLSRTRVATCRDSRRTRAVAVATWTKIARRQVSPATAARPVRRRLLLRRGLPRRRGRWCRSLSRAALRSHPRCLVRRCSLTTLRFENCQILDDTATVLDRIAQSIQASRRTPR